MIRVLLADDHTLVRQAIRHLLEEDPDLEIVGETGSSLEVMRLLDSHKPDILILDIGMPDLSGLEVLRQIHEQGIATRVVVLSIFSDEAHVMEALRQGALAYVTKSSAADSLLTAIREAMKRQRYLSSPLTDMLIGSYIQQVEFGSEDPYETLSPREREVLHLAAHGNTSAEIATKLSVGRRTVETYRSNIMRKLGLRSQMDLLRYAIKRGILPLDD